MNKQQTRSRRARRTRSHIAELGVVRLCVHRTPQHIYAQVISADGSKVIASASSLDKGLRPELGYGGNVKAANAIGKAIAERALKAGVTEVAFDRSGFRFHGRVKALADAAREQGLKF